MVILGEIGRPHGVRGEVKLHSFTSDPCAIAAYGVLVTDKGEAVTLKNVRAAHDHVIARIEGVTDRDGAERLKGRKLQVARDALPEIDDEDEEYAADLVGLTVADEAGHVFGEVIAVQNYGAGDLIEIAVEGTRRTVLLPFTDDVVIDIVDERMIIEAGEGSIAAAFFAPVSETPPTVEGGPEPANDNPEMER